MSAERGTQDGGWVETARVFFALWPPPEAAQHLSDVADVFAQCAGGRATRRTTVHLTLAFIGDVKLERLADLKRAARHVRAEAFDLTLDHFGLWHHKRIFWAGCSVVPPALVELASALRTALQAAEFDVADARRNFFPHVTLVRKVMAPGTQLPNHAPLSWPCAHFVLVSSSLSAKRAAYRMIAEYPLITAALSLGEL
ncbi:MAG TPA: RNA 2',3'-cyclic phosphodiesterase [Azonexus sp.]|nr:RNA 2',3'-cyclic phosphodiesterase [Azonexus sp.]